MKGHAALFPELDKLMAAEAVLTERLGDVRRRSAERDATATEVSSEWLAELRSQHFDRPQDLEALIDWTFDALDTGIVQVTHPGYLGLFNPAPTFAAECADRIIAAFNPQICVYSHAPAAVEIEQHVIHEVTRRAGLPAGSGGHFTSGGAEANSTALLCALQAKCPEYADEGISAFGGRPTIYASRESHLAWLKIAHASGIGRDAVRLVKTDGEGRMDSLSLEHAIQSDLSAGFVPVLVVATAGTTNAGMIDPLEASGALAREHGLWFHADAAWGGAAIAHDTLRGALSGIERADSLTIDAHKWFATTMGAGMFLTSRPDILSDAFRVAASYMPENDAVRDLYTTSQQWSRRFVGLRLFLSLGSAGWQGYGEHVGRSVALIDRLAETLQRAGWTRVNDSVLGVACLVPPEGEDAVQHYLDRVLEDGRFWVSKAVFERKTVLRACVTNGRTDEKVIDDFADLLVGAVPSKP